MIHLKDMELIYQWAEVLQSKILLEGVPLSPQEVFKARLAGVENIKKVRVLKVDSIILPDISLISKLKKANKLDDLGTLGLSLGYGVILHKNAPKDILYHELRHVAQYELFGDLKEFIMIYLKEVIKFGYGNGPFENDAHLFKSKQVEF